MTAAIILILAALAAARATRVIVDDKITEPIRRWLAVHLRQPEFEGRLQTREGSAITYLVHCTWCAGLWVAAGVGAAAWWGGLNDALPLSWWAGYPLTTLAVAWAVGILKNLDGE